MNGGVASGSSSGADVGAATGSSGIGSAGTGAGPASGGSAIESADAGVSTYADASDDASGSTDAASDALSGSDGQANEAADGGSDGGASCPAVLCAPGETYCDYRCVAVDAGCAADDDTYTSYGPLDASVCFVGFTMCGEDTTLPLYLEHYIGPCVDEDSDPANCGACGHSCAPGLCIAGQCTTLAAIFVVTGPVTGLAVDSNNLYFADGQTVWQVDKARGTKLQVASNQTGAWRVAADGSYVYWTSLGAGAILRAPIGGGQVEVLYSMSAGPVGLAVDATNVYWSEPPTGNELYGHVFAAPKTGGGTVRPLGADLSDVSGFNYTGYGGWSGAPDPLFQSSTSVFGIGTYGGIGPDSDGDMLVGADKTTGLLQAFSWNEAVLGTPNIVSFAADDSRVYFYAAATGSDPPAGYTSNIYSEPSIGFEAGTGFALGVPGVVSDPMPVTDHIIGSGSMAADGCSGYVAADGVIYKITPGGPHPVPFVQGVSPGQMVVDDTYLYWADQGGIARTLK